MIKVKLSIIKTIDEYRAILQLQTGENPYLANRVVYQSSREIEDNLVNMRAISNELREEAKEWAREHKIPYVVNIDLDL